MNQLSPQSSDYVATWRLILSDWLHWDEPRIQRFIARWQEDLDAPESSTESQMFFRDSPIRFIAQVLQPAALRKRSIGPEDDPMEVTRNIERAVAQEYPYKIATHDWAAAHKRVEAILAQYGASLPTPDQPAWYEEEDAKIRAFVSRAATKFATSKRADPLDVPRTAKPAQLAGALLQQGKLGVRGFTIEQALEMPSSAPSGQETEFLAVVMQTPGTRKVVVFHYDDGWFYWIYDFR